jgi:hypothetical protein
MTKTTKRTKKATKRTATKSKGAKPAKKATAKRTPRKATTKAAKTQTAATKPTAKAATPRAPKPRDPRLPPAGTTLIRPYKGKDYEVLVRENDFVWNGDEYRSLSKLASVLTGHPSINGYLWMRLTEPKKPATNRTTRATAAGRKGASKGEPAGDTAPQGAADA